MSRSRFRLGDRVVYTRYICGEREDIPATIIGRAKRTPNGWMRFTILIDDLAPRRRRYPVGVNRLTREGEVQP
jgi:hypothetical protein